MMRGRLLVAALAVIPGMLVCQAPKSAADWRQDDLFPSDRVLDVQITVKKADWKTLCRQSRTLQVALGAARKRGEFDKPFSYITGDVSIDGVSFAKVGIRKKGFVGSLSNTRPSLKIKLNYEDKAGVLAGWTNLTFNNNQQDECLASQFLTYQLANAIGVPAPRVSFARMTVNGKYLGVYTHIEAVREPLLQRGFGTSKGVLFEGTAVDFVKGWANGFEHKVGDAQRGQERIEKLITVLADAEDADLTAEVGKLVDLDAFYKYWALEGLLGIWDGYTGGQNNYYVYLHPETNRFYFMPWGADASFVEYGMEGRVKGAPMSVKTGARLSFRLYQTLSGRDRYQGEMMRLLKEHWSEKALLAECDRLEDLLEPHLGRTQRRMTDRLDDLRDFVEARREVVLAEITAGMPLWDKKPRQPFVIPAGGWDRTIWGAARDGDVAELQRYLGLGDSVNMRSEDNGGSLLALAAVAGQLDAVTFLLAKGANASSKSDDGNTPLHAAAFFGRVEVVAALIDAGADLDGQNDDGETPLDAAAGAWSEQIEGAVKFFGGTLKMEVDPAVVKANRPKAAALLRKRGAKSGK
ncbi:MAG: spore coat protein CotH [Neolewinella sp.]|jgi:spore coat protein CotH